LGGVTFFKCHAAHATADGTLAALECRQCEYQIAIELLCES